MNHLLIAATHAEIAPWASRFTAEENTVTEVDILITGVGLTACTHGLTRQIGLKKPDMIIQAGIAGCFDPGLEPGALFAVGKDLVADQGVWEEGVWKSTIDMGFTDGNTRPYTSGWLENNFLPRFNPAGLPVVPAITVNQVSTHPELIKAWRTRYDPVLESMEGAALHYVAAIEQIPFVQIRAVSNQVGERNKKNWDIPIAIRRLNELLFKILPLQ